MPSVVFAPWRAMQSLFRKFGAYASVMQCTVLAQFPRVRERYAGAIDLSPAKTVAVFSHYDPDGAIQEYVVHYVKSLAVAGIATIFVSSSPRFNPGAVETILPFTALVLRRVNIGHDFGSYRDGLLEIPDIRQLDRLILANDSVYGPIFDLAPVLARCDAGASVWGLTDSWDKFWHLQSYFLVFRPDAINSRAFQQFWNTMLFGNDKVWAIRHYEIGFSRQMLRAGVHVRALFPYRTTRDLILTRAAQQNRQEGPSLPEPDAQQEAIILRLARDGVTLNQTHFFWDTLICDFGFPFIKRDLLRANREGVPHLFRWPNVIASVSSYDPDLIDRHLQIIARNRMV